jgi:nitric oxide reductase large subunit
VAKIDEREVIAGGIVWLALMAIMSAAMSRIETQSCGSEDFFMYALIGIGMLAPSYFVSAIFSKGY